MQNDTCSAWHVNLITEHYDRFRPHCLCRFFAADAKLVMEYVTSVIILYLRRYIRYTLRGTPVCHSAFYKI